MMAAALAKGRTTLVNCAREPEVEELGRVLNKMGAEVDGAGTDVIHIRGSERGELAPFDHAIIPDRIEAGTYMVAAAIAEGGDVTLEGAELARPRGARREDARRRASRSRARARTSASAATGPCAPVNVTTAPHPGFPTDMQAQFLVLMCLARGRERHQRDHLREPLHARPRAAAHGRERRASRQHRGRAGRRQALRRERDGHRSARERVARHRRASSPRTRPRCAASITSIAATSASRRSCAGSARRSSA